MHHAAGEPVVIGVVVRTHGVRGLVRVRPTGPTLAGLRPGEAVELVDRDGASRRLVVASHAAVSDGVLVGFDAITTREEADALRGGTIRVDAARLPQAREAGEFYVRELVGCEVQVGGVAFGTVRDVISRPANDVLEVVGEGGTIRLLPFTSDAVVAIDLAMRRIELRGGLIDLAAASGDTEGGGDAG